MNKIQPIANFVLIDLAEQEEETAGGIIIPETAQEKTTEGAVTAKGPGATDEIDVGDRVIYKEYGGSEISHEGNDYLLIRDEDILAKFVEADAI